MKPKTYDGLPFFIHTGTVVSKDRLSKIQNAIGARVRGTQLWFNRYNKGREIYKAMTDAEEGAIKNVNVTFAYNAYFKFLHQSLLSLRDSFRIVSTDFTKTVERPTEVLKSYLSAIQTQNDLLIDDAILYGCAAIMLDVNLDTETPNPEILINRVKAAKLIYDFEQPGSALFTIRVTPEMAHTLDFLNPIDKERIFNYANADAESVAELRVFSGDLVVDGKLDTYLAIIFRKQVIYAESNRTLTSVRAVSINDKNTDISPIYIIQKSAEICRDVYKLTFEYNEENLNPIRTGNWNYDAKAWEEAKRTRFLKTNPTTTANLTPLLPGNLDINGLMNIQTLLQTTAQEATGLNDYTLGQSQGSVRTAAEAMMLSDSASGILNILANKMKIQLILPILSDVLEILKVALAGVTDIFDDSLQVDTDIAKDQQEANLLLSLINMPMFGAVIQGLNSVEALQLFRWILEKLHITGTTSVFDSLIETATNNLTNNTNTRSK
jgi:hypothetical protein